MRMIGRVVFVLFVLCQGGFQCVGVWIGGFELDRVCLSSLRRRLRLRMNIMMRIDERHEPSPSSAAEIYYHEACTDVGT